MRMPSHTDSVLRRAVTPERRRSNTIRRSSSGNMASKSTRGTALFRYGVLFGLILSFMYCGFLTGACFGEAHSH